MNLEDKKELVRLLNLYQAELLKEDTKNRLKGAWQTGIKAQYNHARIISSKLTVGSLVRSSLEFMRLSNFDRSAYKMRRKYDLRRP